jgi:hypothetical protein
LRISYFNISLNFSLYLLFKKCGFKGYYGEVEEHEKVCSSTPARFSRVLRVANDKAYRAVRKMRKVGSRLVRGNSSSGGASTSSSSGSDTNSSSEESEISEERKRSKTVGTYLHEGNEQVEANESEDEEEEDADEKER